MALPRVSVTAALTLGAGATAAAACVFARRCCATSSGAIASTYSSTTEHQTTGTFNLSTVALVSLDLDGTLCRRDGTVSARNIAALAALRRQGVTVVLATGRPGSSARSLPSLVGGEVDYIDRKSVV